MIFYARHAERGVHAMINTINEKSCGVIIFHKEPEREYLILHYHEGHWDFPKGHVEAGEDEKQTASRELGEETGITEVSFRDGFREKIDYFYTHGGRKYHKDVYFYLAETQEKEIKLSHEHINYRWLPYKEAQKLVTHENAKELLRKAEEFLRME